MMDPPDSGPKLEASSTATHVVEREVTDFFPGAPLPDDPQDDAPPDDAPQDPFFYGSRRVRVSTAQGSVLQEIPLTRADLLDPREGDYVPQSFEHGDIVSETKETMRTFFKSRGHVDVVVCDDVKMLWKDPKLDQVAPDIAVIPEMKDPQRRRDSFNEEKEGTRPVFVLEVVSKSTRGVDYDDKPSTYLRAKVKELFILDPLGAAWKIEGYRLHPPTKKYRKIRSDKQSRYLAETLGLRLSLAPGGGLILEDAATGERLLSPSEESAARRQEAEARKAAERQAAREAEARETAERLAAREAEAREAAERQAAREAETRETAERLAAREAEARETAERLAAREAEAREATEAQNQELLAEIERLQAKFRESTSY